MGKSDKMSEAFEAYSDELFRHCYLRISDRERAAELTQEAFLRTWNYMQTHEILEVRPFLYRTLRNLIIDEYRKNKPVSLEGMVDEDGSLDTILPADESNTLEVAMQRLDGSQALERLKDLPDTYREVIIMRFVEGLTPREIAETIEESENVVSVRIHRGLKKLKALLEETL